MSPTPPPSYLDIYPDLAEDRPVHNHQPETETRFPPINLSSEDDEDSPGRPDLVQQVSMTHLDPYSLQTPETIHEPIPSLAHQDSQHSAPSLGSTLHSADDFEWSSVASFPCPRASTPFPVVSPEQTDRQEDTQTDTRIDTLTDRQVVTQTDTQTDRQVDIQTDTQRHRDRQPRSASSSSAPVRVFTISNRRGGPRSHSQASTIRPTTC